MSIVTPRRKRRPLATTPPVRQPEHYTVTHKEGFAPVCHCCRGAQITLPKTSKSSPSAEMRAFLLQHDDCLPSDRPQEQEAS